MKIEVPVEVDVNLTPYQIICYLREWIIPILRDHKKKNSDWCNSRAIVKDGILYWQYRPTMGGNGYDKYDCEIQYEPINIQDEKVFNLCKAAVELLDAYADIHAKSKYSKIN